MSGGRAANSFLVLVREHRWQSQAAERREARVGLSRWSRARRRQVDQRGVKQVGARGNGSRRMGGTSDGRARDREKEVDGGGRGGAGGGSRRRWDEEWEKNIEHVLGEPTFDESLSVPPVRHFGYWKGNVFFFRSTQIHNWPENARLIIPVDSHALSKRLLGQGTLDIKKICEPLAIEFQTCGCSNRCGTHPYAPIIIGLTVDRTSGVVDRAGNPVRNSSIADRLEQVNRCGNGWSSVCISFDSTISGEWAHGRGN